MDAPQQPALEELLATKTVAVNAHTHLADALEELSRLKASRSWKMTAPYRWLGGKMKGLDAEPENIVPYQGKDLSSQYYQDLHEKDEAYQANNWLLSEKEHLLKCRPRTLLEVGCGNGRFLREVASDVENAIGLDWAISPLTDNMPRNVSIKQADVTKDKLPSADLVCSADVLEHFHPDSIQSVITKVHRAGKFNYHVVACYDDHHSHLTIIKPGEWLYLFRQMSPNYNLLDIRPRRNNPGHLVAVIANF